MRALRTLRRTWRAIWFIGFYLRELVVSNLYVAHEVVTARHYQQPGIVRFPIRAETDFEITLLANAISFTPGTLTLDIAEDRTALFVHLLWTESPEQARARLAALETRLLAVMRA